MARTSASRSPAKPEQVLLRLARRPHRLHGFTAKITAAGMGLDFAETFGAARTHDQSTSSARTSSISMPWSAGHAHRIRFQRPRQRTRHGLLTVNGEKMSKCRGTFLRDATFAQPLRPEFLRYFYASKLTDLVEDIDLGIADFISKTNADLVKVLYANLASRSGPMLTRQLDDQGHDDCQGHPGRRSRAVVVRVPAYRPFARGRWFR